MGCSAYADYLVLLSFSVTELQKIVVSREVFGRENGLSFNAKKSKCVKFARQPSEGTPAASQSSEFDMEWVDTFPYLRHLFQKDPELGKLLKRRRSCIAKRLREHDNKLLRGVLDNMIYAPTSSFAVT